MAVFYVRSTDGDDADDGSTWALAKATLNGAFTAASAGDTIYVSQTHAEVNEASQSLVSPGTVESPCKILCVNDAAEPPTTLAATGSVSTTVSYYLSFKGCAYYYGIIFTAGSGTGGAVIYINDSAAQWSLHFDTCSLQLGGSGSAGKMLLGATGTSTRDRYLRLTNCILALNSTAHYIVVGCKIDIFGGSFGAVAAAYPTYIFNPSLGYSGMLHASGWDLSELGSGKSLVEGGSYGQNVFQFSNCLLGASVSVIQDPIGAPGGVEVYLDQCDSGDPSSGPRSEAYTYQGSVITDTAIVRTGGASDGTAYSLKMTANAAGVSFISPLVTRLIPLVAETTGSAMTVTAHIAMEEGATPLTEAQCWMEVEYMGTDGSTLTSFTNDHNSTLLAASTTDQTTSTETWTRFTGTPVKQKLAVTFTPAEKGFYMVRVYLARPAAATTGPPVYVCPKFVVS